MVEKVESEQVHFPATGNEHDAGEDRLLVLLEQIREHSQQQEAYIKKTQQSVRVIQFLLGGLLALGILCALVLVPPAINLMNQAQQVVESARLEEVDLPALAQQAQALMEQASSTLQNIETELEQVGDQVEQLDIQALNQAIENLRDAVKPLAFLFGGRE